MATLVQRWDRARHGGEARLTFAQAASLARGLGDFLDEVETQEADLSNLDSLAPDSLAAHWAEVKGFLEYMRDEWPKRCLRPKAGPIPAVRRRAMLGALAEKLQKSTRRSGPVVAAGTTGSIPATARLLGVIARLERGAVVLPGLDRELDEESWSKLDPGHPQYGMKQLLARIGVMREDVKNWTPGRPAITARETLLRETLRPAPTTDAWREMASRSQRRWRNRRKGLEGLSLVDTAHPGEEAMAVVSLVLREALETPGRTAALVTPDRNLARRVAARKWDALEYRDRRFRRPAPCEHTSGRVPLASCRSGHRALRARAFCLRTCLNILFCRWRRSSSRFPAQGARTRSLLPSRGPRPDHGLDGIAGAITSSRPKGAGTNRMRKRLSRRSRHGLRRPRTTLRSPRGYGARCTRRLNRQCLLSVHAAVAEALAATDDRSQVRRGSGAEMPERRRRHWLIAALEDESRGLSQPSNPSSYPVLFRALAEERAIRPAYGLHPRLAILGTQEARLQSFDVLVLGGLNEGAWPRAAAADPWLSRPMRAKLGLEPPERAIGLSAHDFATLAAGPRVVLTRALKSEGSPTTPSRWLQRLLQLTKGLKLDDKLTSATRYDGLASAMATPDTVTRIGRPEPRPPVESRPRSLSVTEIETWLRDPYAIYAKHVLKLRLPLDPLDAPIGPLERGTAIHTVLEQTCSHRECEHAACGHSRHVIDRDRARTTCFAIPESRKPLLHSWWPRFLRAATLVRRHRTRACGP